jgi:hypothetical protein
METCCREGQGSARAVAPTAAGRKRWRCRYKFSEVVLGGGEEEKVGKIAGKFSKRNREMLENLSLRSVLQ